MFTEEMRLKITCWFDENDSGTQLHRPELFRLFDMAMPGNAILVEQVDKISYLNTDDWVKLKYLIGHKGLKVIFFRFPNQSSIYTLYR